MASWAFIDFLLLAAAGMSIGLSIVWRAPNILMNMAISSEFLTAGLVLGIVLAVTFLVSLGAVVQRNHVTIGFVILNWFLIVDAILVTVVGSIIWFFSLRQRAEMQKKWTALSPADRITIQDQHHCCGYFSANDSEIGGTFCANTTFTQSLNLNPNITTNFCVTPITLFTDYTLENTFTTVSKPIYGFMAVVLSLLVASLCVIKKRQEEERFKKIDAKRGGRGFV
ncbi:25S rRNA adenine-N(1) methyltransferase [Mycena venus]|uniref:25S rRNA adenine-N(1) methyltransferase n=1 Tax=Mycena venus TaxID=2733690 RepID=A0A8H6XC60_9AGAR|nr:25S rRNA adenine-N(1) methyltransferase [Mycena venus]